MIYRRLTYKKDEPTYHVRLYRKEVKALQRASNDEHFFKNYQNFLPFTQNQKSDLKDRLLNYRFFIENETESRIIFGFKNDGVKAVLTDAVLYFVATWDDDNIFESRMTASEFTDTEEFVKYDPQYKGWEEIEY